MFGVKYFLFPFENSLDMGDTEFKHTAQFDPSSHALYILVNKAETKHNIYWIRFSNSTEICERSCVTTVKKVFL